MKRQIPQNKPERRLLPAKEASGTQRPKETRLTPGEGPNPIGTALAVKDTTTKGSAKTQESGTQELGDFSFPP